MGTKETELLDGCFAKAMPGEFMFVLLARDLSAPDYVDAWAFKREVEISEGKRPASDMAQVIEARQTAANMRKWRIENEGAWRRDSLFADKADGMVRPANCREQLRMTGQPYLRSHCEHCGSMLRQPGWKCPFEKDNPDAV